MNNLDEHDTTSTTERCEDRDWCTIAGQPDHETMHATEQDLTIHLAGSEQPWSTYLVESFNDPGNVRLCIWDGTLTGQRVDVSVPLFAHRQTAQFTWRDMLPQTLRDIGRLEESERGGTLIPAELLEGTADESVGGLLMWNKTRDEEGGHFVMFTGQDAEQEVTVIANAEWMVSCGALYAAARVGWKSYKTRPDFLIDVGGNEMLVWLLPCNENIPGLQ